VPASVRSVVLSLFINPLMVCLVSANDPPATDCLSGLVVADGLAVRLAFLTRVHGFPSPAAERMS